MLLKGPIRAYLSCAVDSAVTEWRTQMAVNRPFGTDEKGNSPHGISYIELPAQQQATLEQQQAALAKVSASAEARLIGQHALDQGYDLQDMNTFLAAKSMSTDQRILVKRTIERTGKTVQQVLADLRIS
jgi:hypothetical protein